MVAGNRGWEPLLTELDLKDVRLARRYTSFPGSDHTLLHVIDKLAGRLARRDPEFARMLHGNGNGGGHIG